ncbi:hypothetical protein BDQ17DRAFT_1328142 [Cyathus striatus]|nr:hypothetical protein BDQ17DRAFT_1328142 [Cyathus striatus]
MEGSLEQLLTLLQHMQIISYFHVASLALWVFEHSITMHLEISYIWRSSHWSIVQIMYLVVRYGAYIDISLNVVVQCFPSLSVRSWILLPGMTAVEVILTLRVWAVWKKSRNMGILLFVSFFSVVISSWVNGGILANSVTFDAQEYLVRGCLVTNGKVATEAAIWGILLAYDTLMMLLLLPPAYDAFRRGGKSTLANIVIRDGIIYYIYLFVASLVNMVIVLKLSRLKIELYRFGRVIYGAISCRIVLNIREQVWKDKRVHHMAIAGYTSEFFWRSMLTSQPNHWIMAATTKH